MILETFHRKILDEKKMEKRKKERGSGKIFLGSLGDGMA